MAGTGFIASAVDGGARRRTLKPETRLAFTTITIQRETLSLRSRGWSRGKMMFILTQNAVKEPAPGRHMYVYYCRT